MKLVVRKTALHDLDAIFEWISRDNPKAARRVISRIRLRLNRLAESGFANAGRIGLIRDTRELVEPPYIVVYEIDQAKREIIVLAVMHGAQDRRPVTKSDVG